MREVLSDEFRRLLGRPRRSRSGVGAPVDLPPPAAATPSTTPSPPPEERDPWAVHVIDHAERVMAGEVPVGDGAAPRGDRPVAAGVSAFEALDLGLVPDAVAHLVRSRRGISEKELVPLLAAELLLGELPANYQRLLGRLVWSARGRRLIELRDGVWVPGTAREGVIPELSGWSLDGLARLAGELKDHDTSDEGVFQAVLASLVGPGERAPRIVAIVVGVAISLARRRGDLDFDRWGQTSLALDFDG
jgi:hypothetical protein